MSSPTLIPKWQKLLVVQNDTGGADFPDKLVVMARSNSVPANWEQITFTAGYNFIMGDNVAAGATGGNVDAHTHTAFSHGGHAVTAGNASAVSSTQDYITDTKCSATHVHTWTLTAATDTIYENDVEGGQTAYPPYIGVQLWKYTAPSAGYYATIMVET
jgi:hypothetical protein